MTLFLFISDKTNMPENSVLCERKLDRQVCPDRPMTPHTNRCHISPHNKMPKIYTETDFIKQQYL